MSDARRSSADAIINEPEELSVVAYDNLGNRVTGSSLADVVPDVNAKRTVLNINTRYRWVINKVHKNQDKVICRAS